jgi:hypothetical protein
MRTGRRDHYHQTFCVWLERADHRKTTLPALEQGAIPRRMRTTQSEPCAQG